MFEPSKCRQEHGAWETSYDVAKLSCEYVAGLVLRACVNLLVDRPKYKFIEKKFVLAEV